MACKAGQFAWMSARRRMRIPFLIQEKPAGEKIVARRDVLGKGIGGRHVKWRRGGTSCELDILAANCQTAAWYTVCPFQEASRRRALWVGIHWLRRCNHVRDRADGGDDQHAPGG